MWFDASMSKAYNKGIALGVEDAGYKPIRIDRKDHNNKIDDEIIAEIRRSRFLVADFTQGDAGTRGGVYYEAGFAHGLNIPVIFTCREDVIDKVHFDTRQYNHIKWKTPDELRSRLAQRISATIGDGPLRKTG
jgi:nucleoside 2-deoxyribosyltransferase